MRLRVRTVKDKRQGRRHRDLYDIMTEVAIAKYELYGTKRGSHQRREDEEEKSPRETSRTHR